MRFGQTRAESEGACVMPAAKKVKRTYISWEIVSFRSDWKSAGWAWMRMTIHFGILRSHCSEMHEKTREEALAWYSTCSIILSYVSKSAPRIFSFDLQHPVALLSRPDIAHACPTLQDPHMDSSANCSTHAGITSPFHAQRTLPTSSLPSHSHPSHPSSLRYSRCTLTRTHYCRRTVSAVVDHAQHPSKE